MQLLVGAVWEYGYFAFLIASSPEKWLALLSVLLPLIHSCLSLEAQIVAVVCVTAISKVICGYIVVTLCGTVPVWLTRNSFQIFSCSWCVFVLRLLVTTNSGDLHHCPRQLDKGIFLAAMSMYEICCYVSELLTSLLCCCPLCVVILPILPCIIMLTLKGCYYMLCMYAFLSICSSKSSSELQRSLQSMWETGSPRSWSSDGKAWSCTCRWVFCQYFGSRSSIRFRVVVSKAECFYR